MTVIKTKQKQHQQQQQQNMPQISFKNADKWDLKEAVNIEDVLSDDV